MHTQFSTTETCSSQLFAAGLLFDTNPDGSKIDPPDNQGGGGTNAAPTQPEEEETTTDTENQ